MSEEKTVDSVTSEPNENVSRETLLDNSIEAPIDAAMDTVPSTDRPEWLQEKFKTPEELAKAYSELESKIGSKEEEYKQKFEQEQQEILNASRPAKAGDYKINDDVSKLLDMGSVPDNKLINWWAEHAHANGMNHDQFNEGISMYLSQIQTLTPSLEAEKEKLGENVDQRLEAVSLFANKYFSESVMPIVNNIATTADGVKLLEYIQEKSKDTTIGNNSQPISQVNQEQLEHLISSPEYWNSTQRNPDTVRKVEDGFKRLYRT